jgi:hypothetical protein
MKPMPANQQFYAEAFRRKAIIRQTWISVWDSTVKGSSPDNDVFKKMPITSPLSYVQQFFEF